MSIDRIIDGILAREGSEYTDNPNDSGGPTKYGITEKTARAFGYEGAMQDLTRELARSIYLTRYYIDPGFSHISTMLPILAERLADFGVLAGTVTAAKMLQRALNVLNHNGRDYPDLIVDGRLGAITFSALEALLQRRESAGVVIVGMVVAQQSVYLIELAEKRPKDEEFEYGWQLNRAVGWNYFE